MPFNPDRYVEAMRFAAEAHCQQLEPGSHLPYLVHVVAVASEVIASLAAEPLESPHDDIAVQCALLHDTVEDTAITLSLLAERFGDAVAAGVDALSKRSALPKERQMVDSLERILTQPPEIARVKLADRIINLNAPPPYWPNDKRIAYRAEGELILARLGHTSPFLAERLRKRIMGYERYLS